MHELHLKYGYFGLFWGLGFALTTLILVYMHRNVRGMPTCLYAPYSSAVYPSSTRRAACSPAILGFS